ncbi:GAF domain-containing protein [Alteraurantiacibacter buctensis]|uniref:GAF domain-containing protein n=1 Tax=Alteraurantiacibacter buctensis TaxID=1503981 RepID=A0A844YUR1_9SPHN|nr:GAF domain-containing protein [Alteraurantiacibacter buctensis]MXO72075.1 GAF domain-containing protein [Alteraurantiacibacter buctensis]
MTDSELVEAEAALWGRLVSSLRKSSYWQVAIKIGLILGGAFIGALGGAMEGKLFASSGDGLVTLKGLLVVGGGASAFSGGVLLLLADWETPDLLQDARAYLTEVKRYLVERDGLLRLDDKRRALLEMQSDIYEACESLPRETPIDDVLRAILAVGSINLHAAIGFDVGERWAFSVFRLATVDSEEQMQRVAVHWAERGAEQLEGRNWKIKEGFTGWAWADAEEVVVANAYDAEWNGRFLAPSGKILETDVQKYVSAAAIPIIVGLEDRVWGVVTATSNIAGRFKRNPQDVRSQNVDTVRVLARLIATQVALRS